MIYLNSSVMFVTASLILFSKSGYREKLIVYESVGGGSAPECEVTAGMEYEEIDKLREPKKQPPAGDYELIQCDNSVL